MNNENDFLEESVSQEINTGVFDAFVKDKCAWCNAKIEGTLSWYTRYGNCCATCSSRFGQYQAGVRGVRTNNKGKLVNYKIRDFTDEERTELLKARRQQVIKENL